MSESNRPSLESDMTFADLPIGTVLHTVGGARDRRRRSAHCLGIQAGKRRVLRARGNGGAMVRTMRRAMND